jgi:hypothetical protein
MNQIVMWMHQNRWLTAGIGAGVFFLANPKKRRKKRRRRRKR